MTTLRPNEIKAYYSCHLFSSFGSAQTSSEHLGTFSPKFGSLWKVRNLRRWPGGGRDVSGNPSHNKVKPHALDSEKVGRYNIGT